MFWRSFCIEVRRCSIILGLRNGKGVKTGIKEHRHKMRRALDGPVVMYHTVCTVIKTTGD